MARKKSNTSGLDRYRKLRKQATKLGIKVPRGTNLEGLQRLVAGKSTTAQVKASNAKRANSKSKSRKVPSGAKRAKIHWGW